jgi:hypothetical protein
MSNLVGLAEFDRLPHEFPNVVNVHNSESSSPMDVATDTVTKIYCRRRQNHTKFAIMPIYAVDRNGVRKRP